MPSFIFGGSSGGELIISGNPWSGQIRPQGGIQLKLAANSPGSLYVGFSGGITIASGGLFRSGGGLLDGMGMTPGGAYWIPRIATGPSGFVNVYVQGEPITSGQSRLFYEIF